MHVRVQEPQRSFGDHTTQLQGIGGLCVAATSAACHPVTLASLFLRCGVVWSVLHMHEPVLTGCGGPHFECPALAHLLHRRAPATRVRQAGPTEWDEGTTNGRPEPWTQCFVPPTGSHHMRSNLVASGVVALRAIWQASDVRGRFLLRAPSQNPPGGRGCARLGMFPQPNRWLQMKGH